MRKKKTTLCGIYAFSFLLLLLFITITGNAQATPPTTLWARHPDGHQTPYTYPLITSDGDGNTYVTGSFDGTLTFPTSPSPTVLTSAGSSDIFIAKYDAIGNVVWAKQEGGVNYDGSAAIKYDGFGNIYVAGYYSTSTSFDGTILENSVTARNNILIAKFNASNGNLIWVKQGTTTACCADAIWPAIAVDKSGNVYITGGFTNSITFDPLPTIYNPSFWDIYVVKFSRDGIPQWETSASSGEPSHYYNIEAGYGVAVDASGNVYVTGSFNGTSADPTRFGNVNLVSTGGGGYDEGNFFLAKYNQSTLSWEWAVQGGGAANDLGKDVSIDNQGNAYVSGYFEGSATFGSTTLTSGDGADCFIAKYNSFGNQIWVHSVEGIGWTLSSSKVDASGNLFFAATFDGTVNIGDQTVSSNGYDNFYVSSWNSNGDFQWVKHIPGDYNSLVGALDIESNGNIDISSVFAGSETFDCTTFGSGSYADLGIAKLGNTNGSVAPIIQASSTTVCSGNSATLSIVNGSLNNATDWKWYTGGCGQTFIGNGVSITVSPTQNTTYFVRSEGGCSAPSSCGTISISLDNAQPVINSVSSPLTPNPVNTIVNLTVNSSGTISIANINWGDGTSVQTLSNPPNTLTVPHIYSSPGVYTVLSTVKNSCGLTSQANKYQYIVVYDPNGGFVTGGGWINSPAGAYRQDITVTGKAIFGFESRYLKGASVPSGNTEFKFQVANMNFRSTNYEWLVISGSRAQFKGTGTINGTGNYGFLLKAVDGDLSNTVSPDLFRIKIWDINNNAIVYDNQYSSTDDASITTQIAGGSILIHNDKANAVTTRTTDAASQQLNRDQLSLTASPNPSINHFIVGINSSLDSPVLIRVLDVLGRVMQERTSLKSGQTITIGDNFRPGVYVIEAIQNNQSKTLRMIKVPN
jgi:hypothetical protein